MQRSHDISSGKKIEEDTNKEVDALTMLRFTRTFMEIQKIIDERNEEIERRNVKDEVLGNKKKREGENVNNVSEEKIFNSQAKHMIRKGLTKKGVIYVTRALELGTVEEAQVKKLVAARSKYQNLLGKIGAYMFKIIYIFEDQKGVGEPVVPKLV